MFNWLKARVDQFRGMTVRALALFSEHLGGVLWLIEAKFLPLAREAYSKNEVVYACVNVLASSVPEPPLIAYQKSKSSEEREPLSYDHDLMKLIKAPNELMTEYEFWELTTICMAIVGRAFWWKRRDNAGRLIALWPLRPDRVGPIYSDSDEPGEQVLWGWSYQQPGRGDFRPIPRRDMLAFNFPDPAGETGGIVEGFGPVQALARQIASDNEATKFVGALLANYAIPGVAVKLKREVRNDAEAQAVKAHFRSEFGGANRGTLALLDAETDLTEIGFNLRELEFPELREVSESRISGALGVPAVLAQLRIGLKESNNRASLAELREYFAETTLSNYWRRYSDQYTNDIAAEFGEGIVCEFDTSKVKALAAQRAQQIAPVVEGFKAGGVLLNEYRAALNLPPVMGGNVRLVPGNVIEVPAEMEEEAVKALQAGGKLRLLPGVKAVDPRDEAERNLMRGLEQLFAKWVPELAERIRQGQPISDQEIADGLSRVIEPQLVAAATGEGIRLAAEMTIGFDPAIVNDAMAQWARSYSFELVSGLTETTKKVLQNAVSKYAETPGMTIGELETLIEPAFGKERAFVISQTEITRSYSQAMQYEQEQLNEMGIEMERRWLTNADELVCPICGPLHKKPESEWLDRYPSGPPAHPRCRCSLSLTSVAKKKAVA